MSNLPNQDFTPISILLRPGFCAPLLGYGQERGGIRLELHNAGNVSLPAEVFQSVPWFLKVHLHTLHAAISGVPRPDVVERVYFQPALDRGRPAVLEMEVEVPPRSAVALEFDFEKVFLKYTEHPPDANRGFDLGDVSLIGMTGYQQRVYTGNLLVSLPTPDFSMPYNVITLTCTLVALFLGS
ncbi:MAG: GPI transamidase component PIG-T, partial [Olpidium bornovanus]